MRCISMDNENTSDDAKTNEYHYILRIDTRKDTILINNNYNN